MTVEAFGGLFERLSPEEELWGGWPVSGNFATAISGLDPFLFFCGEGEVGSSLEEEDDSIGTSIFPPVGVLLPMPVIGGYAYYPIAKWALLLMVIDH